MMLTDAYRVVALNTAVIWRDYPVSGATFSEACTFAACMAQIPDIGPIVLERVMPDGTVKRIVTMTGGDA